jgi:hypothetical protein
MGTNNEFFVWAFSRHHNIMSWYIRPLFLIPLIFIFFLCLAFWKRSFKTGALVLVIMTFSKMLWSIISGGESGTSIFVPALVGLVICGFVLYCMLHKKKKK